MISDVAYGEIYFDNNPPPSILQVDGAKDIAVEVNSLSKTYAMAGWRVGMVVGNARICAALARVKSYLDYGAYTPGAGGRRRRPERPAGLRRRDPRHLQEPPRHPDQSMKRAGWDIPNPPASMFAWAKIPPQFEAAGSMLFSRLLIEEAGVAVAPGIGFGEYGEGYVRIGLVENEQRIKQAARNVKKFIANADTILAKAHNKMEQV